jgi:hypothetical protein
MSLQRGETTVILKQVPADVCDKLRRVLPIQRYYSFGAAEGRIGGQAGAEVEILRFAA